ncbi:unnamed protein product [Amoebophrya sp. A120]|nr:unnamed protein product [Amoebophrya sp. A120]|eukprot:GSA120T00015000001.1
MKGVLTSRRFRKINGGEEQREGAQRRTTGEIYWTQLQRRALQQIRFVICASGVLCLVLHSDARNSDELLPVPLSRLSGSELAEKRAIINAGAATLPFASGGTEEQNALKFSLDLVFSIVDRTVSLQNVVESLDSLRNALHSFRADEQVPRPKSVGGRAPWSERLSRQVVQWSDMLARNQTRFAKKVHGKELCEKLPSLLDEIWMSVVLYQSGRNDGELVSASLPVHEFASELLGRSKCCQTLVQKQLYYAWSFLLEPATEWHVQERFRSLWQCMERMFWGPGYAKPLSSIRGLLWDTTMDAMDLRRYAVNEALTVQFAFLPLCVHRTLATEFDRWVDIGQFNAHYMHCQVTHLAFALDHLKISGNHARFAEVYDHVRTHKVQTLAGATWWSPHYTAIGGLPGLLAWPWWQLHPKVKPVVEFLEKHFDTLAAEVRFLEDDEQLLSDAYRDTARNLRWHMVNLLGKDERAKRSCQRAPETCRLLEEHFPWNTEEDYSQKRWSWSVVRPGGNMGGHTGQTMRLNVQICAQGCEAAELHVNGQVIPYIRGKALAWQDGWRHEVWNHDATQSRWVFMMTLPHPDLEEAMESQCARRALAGAPVAGTSKSAISTPVEKEDGDGKVARGENFVSTSDRAGGGPEEEVSASFVSLPLPEAKQKSTSEYHSGNSRRSLQAQDRLKRVVEKSDARLRKRKDCPGASWPAAYAQLREPDPVLVAEKFSLLARANDPYYRE